MITDACPENQELKWVRDDTQMNLCVISLCQSPVLYRFSGKESRKSCRISQGAWLGVPYTYYADHGQHDKGLQHNLLYTAIARAYKSCTLIGCGAPSACWHETTRSHNDLPPLISGWHQSTELCDPCGLRLIR